MGEFKVLNQEQQMLCRECGIDPEGMTVILENDSALVMMHLRTRNEVSIYKNVRVKHGNSRKGAGTPNEGGI